MGCGGVRICLKKEKVELVVEIGGKIYTCKMVQISCWGSILKGNKDNN